MSELTNGGPTPPLEKGQSGAQIWLVCLLFILVPTLVILAIKQLFAL